MLMFTQNQVGSEHARMVNPFAQDLNEDNPSPTSQYSRDWSKTEIPTPVGGSEFLLKRGNSGEFVRFVQGNNKSFCGFGQENSDCDLSNSDIFCLFDEYNSEDYYEIYVTYEQYYIIECDKVARERYITEGTACDQDNKLLPNIEYFTGCNRYDGNCRADYDCSNYNCDEQISGGIGFSSHHGYLDNSGYSPNCHGRIANRGYGLALDGTLLWNSTTKDSGENYTYWYRESSGGSQPTPREPNATTATTKSTPLALNSTCSIRVDGE